MKAVFYSDMLHGGVRYITFDVGTLHACLPACLCSP